MSRTYIPDPFERVGAIVTELAETPLDELIRDADFLAWYRLQVCQEGLETAGLVGVPLVQDSSFVIALKFFNDTLAEVADGSGPHYGPGMQREDLRSRLTALGERSETLRRELGLPRLFPPTAGNLRALFDHEGSIPARVPADWSMSAKAMAACGLLLLDRAVRCWTRDDDKAVFEALVFFAGMAMDMASQALAHVNVGSARDNVARDRKDHGRKTGARKRADKNAMEWALLAKAVHQTAIDVLTGHQGETQDAQIYAFLRRTSYDSLMKERYPLLARAERNWARKRLREAADQCGLKFGWGRMSPRA